MTEQQESYRVERPVVTPAEMRVIEHLRRAAARARARGGRPEMVIVRVVDGVFQVFEAAPRGIIEANQSPFSANSLYNEDGEGPPGG